MFDRALTKRAEHNLEKFKRGIIAAATTQDFKGAAIEATNTLLHELLHQCVGQYSKAGIDNKNLKKLVEYIKDTKMSNDEEVEDLKRRNKDIKGLNNEDTGIKNALDKYLQEVVSIYIAVDEIVEAVEKIKNSDIRSKSQATKERCNEGCGKIIACTAAALLAFGALAVCAAPLVAGAALATMATSAGVGSGLIAASAATFVYALSQGEVEVSDLQATTLNNINPEQVAARNLMHKAQGGKLTFICEAA